MKDRITMIRRPHGSRGTIRRRLVAAVIAAVPAAAFAADLPPEVVTEFTRRVQPLVLNRCAAGACHGGPESPEPRFLRRDPRGGIDRRSTLANMRAVLDAVGPQRDPSKVALLLASRHPASAATQTFVAAPLTPQERTTLDRWLASVRATERRVFNPGVRQVAAEEPALPQPNRFKALLDSAANPPQLPPPQKPRGVIFPKDVPPEE